MTVRNQEGGGTMGRMVVGNNIGNLDSNLEDNGI